MNEEKPVGRLLTPEEIDKLPVGIVSLQKIPPLFDVVDDNTVGTIVSHKRGSTPIIFLMAIPCTLSEKIETALQLLEIENKSIDVVTGDFSDFAELQKLMVEVK